MPLNKKTFAILVSSIFGVVILTAVLSFLYYFSFINSRIGKSIDLVVEKGMSKTQVLNKLCENNCDDFIHLNMLRTYLYLNSDIVIEAGSYSIKESDSFANVLNSFKNGTKQIKVTFLPGWSVEENTLELKKMLGSDFATKYYNLAKKDQGYLYPDTYFVDQSSTPEQLVKNQKDTFNLKTKNLFTSNTDISLEQKVIIASIVQREALGVNDNKVISGILLKRFKEGMSLDADATNQYAVFLNSVPNFVNQCILADFCSTNNFEIWKKGLTDADLKLDSPFNSRGKVGLPPYSISNPSISTLEAVVRPEDTLYYYYLHDNKGNTYYAKSLEEHIANINKYL